MTLKRVVILALVIGGAAVVLVYALATGLLRVGGGLQQATQPLATPAETDALEAEVVAYLESYFATWSAGDMEGYRDHFHEQATILYVAGGAVQSVMARDPFVDMQARIIAQAPEPMRETMTSYVVEVDEVSAAATVDWLLEAGARRETGVDRFVLVRDADGVWRAISLLFYATAPGAE